MRKPYLNRVEILKMHEKVTTSCCVQTLKNIVYTTDSWQVTLDLESGLGVPPPSTLLFILLFISGLGAIPRQNERDWN